MVPVSFTFPFCGDEFVLTRANALYWPRERALLVADLHLEKASFFAKHGQFLPPYDSRETLERLACAIRDTGARRVLCLGDNFHDSAGMERLDPHAAGMLAALTRATDWMWLTGNHDVKGAKASAPAPDCGGTTLPELEIAGMILRHQAQAGELRPELSGHFHPRLAVRVQRRHIRRPCAVIASSADGSGRMILPAFGALTGGMNADDPVIVAALQPAHSIDAVVPTASRLARFPLWREAA